jgi:copper chaperone CopZ
MKKILLVMALGVSLFAQGQVKKVTLQASGLTCSMCSNAINKALKSLDFVSGVEADIKTYSFEVSFKPGSIADFDLIRNKVEAAGFAVSAFYADLNFSNLPVKSGEPVIIQGKTFLFVGTKNQLINGDKRVKILDKGFVTVKEHKLNSYLPQSPQTYHVTL